jgi:hypothetical protein
MSKECGEAGFCGQRQMSHIPLELKRSEHTGTLLAPVVNVNVSDLGFSHEFRAYAEACFDSPLYKEAIAQFDLPDGFVVTIDPVRLFRFPSNQ